VARVAQLTAETIVGRDFRILSAIGSGGMATVYLAEQLSTGRKRAVKVMHDRWLDDDKQRERFVREAKVGARVQSAHVADVIAAGTEDDGTAWIAMELLEGEDLAAFLRQRGPLSPAELVEILEQICHAIGAAHDADLVHRDIKPENIFIAHPREARARPLVKVLDFGIAKLVAPTRSGTTASVGSPTWMAPEQADSKVAVTAATDVWALGLLAFWLLTGRSFWNAVQDTELSIHALMKEILFDDLPLASRRAAELGVAARLPPGFDDWFDRCVHREPRARFTDADALLQGLRELVQGDEQPSDPSQPAAAGEGGAGLGDVATMPISTGTFLKESGIGQTEELPPDSADDGSGDDGCGGVDSDDDDGQRDDERASERTAPLPESRTSEPRIIEPTSAEPAGRRGLLLGGLAIVLVAAALVSLLRSQPDPASGQSTGARTAGPVAATATSSLDAVESADDTSAQPLRSGAATATASGAASAPVASPLHEAESATAPSAVPSASASATASTSSNASSKEARLFQQQSAMRAVARQGGTARRRCSGKTGPKSWSGTVTVAPSGKAIRVHLDDLRNRQSSAGLCVQWTMRLLNIVPYQGVDETLPFLVTLD